MFATNSSRYFRTVLSLRLRVTNSGRGNSANSLVNIFGVDAYTMINSAVALVCKTASCIRKMGATNYARRDARRHIF